jgi:hypothetical protein
MFGILSLLLFTPIVAALTTISGISAGGFASVQLHVANSGVFNGSGIISAGPYLCAVYGIEACMKTPYLISPQYLWALTKMEALIDSIKNLEKQRVWIYYSSKDTVVHSSVTEKLAEYYLLAGTQVQVKNDIQSEHSYITDSFGNNCDYLGIPYINNCGQNIAYEMLSYLYNGKLEKGESYDTTRLYNKTIPYNLSARQVFYYIPLGCENGGCDRHLSLHGCLQSYENIGLDYITKLGYLEIAEKNKIIMIFPQMSALNVDHCWDWFGYTGINYINKLGPQQLEIMKLLEN